MRIIAKVSVFIVVTVLITTIVVTTSAAANDRQAALSFGSAQKQILLLNSYHYGMAWVSEIEAGIRSELDDPKRYNINIDFMDAKRNFSPAYIQKTLELLQEKYKDKKFDSIIVTDEDAYQFVLQYQASLFPETPIVFLGINEYKELPPDKRVWITGVVETIDFANTIALALELQPATRKMIIINDKTSTGIVNKQQLSAVLPEYKDRVQFVFWEDVSMAEILEQLPGVTGNTVILLLSFNKDKDNKVFTYEESVDLIAGAARVPIYGIWDFYVSRGIIGGRVTSGFSQGEAAARLTKQILAGQKPEEVPIIMDSPNRYMFNYHQLTNFNIEETALPPDSIVLHKPKSFYNEYKTLVWAFAGTIFFLLVIIAGLYHVMMERRKAADSLKMFATVDPMTGVFNRHAGLSYLEELVTNKQQAVICFADVNELKLVNDTLGHNEGDELIRVVAEAFLKSLRKTDLVCRVGGDEFLLIFPGIGLTEAEKVWTRIVAQLEQYNAISNKPYKVIVSHGITYYDGNREITVDELVREADGAMYQEKYRFREALAEQAVPGMPIG
ncbi:MAG: diguanylate cyclase [Firmicutes bacterium]|nr:diguanylate cyclase [Bacillota bacterium]